MTVWAKYPSCLHHHLASSKAKVELATLVLLVDHLRTDRETALPAALHQVVHQTAGIFQTGSQAAHHPEQAGYLPEARQRQQTGCHPEAAARQR
jgi:hypothetical protein